MCHILPKSTNPDNLCWRAVGREPQNFKYFDVFEEEFAQINSAEIDVSMDESGQ